MLIIFSPLLAVLLANVLVMMAIHPQKRNFLLQPVFKIGFWCFVGLCMPTLYFFILGGEIIGDTCDIDVTQWFCMEPFKTLAQSSWMVGITILPLMLGMLWYPYFLRVNQQSARKGA